MNLLGRLLERSVSDLTRLACILALIGLVLMTIAVVAPEPLAVLSGMSFGHVVGAAALGCYALAIVVDTARRRSSLKPPPSLRADERRE